MPTHDVTNQVPLLVGHDTAQDATLLAAVEREGAAWAPDEIHELGRLAGSQEAQDWGRIAEKHPPVLTTHDRHGNRIDEVEYIPAYHSLMDAAVSHGTRAPWADDRPGAHVARAAKFMVWNVDAGHGCPISMTYAAVPALRANPELAAAYEPLLTSTSYDPGLRVPTTKSGLIAGMADDREAGRLGRAAPTPPAVPRPGRHHRLTGHKWFSLGADERRVPGPRAGRRRAGAASWCRGCCPTEPATPSCSSGSKTSSATGSNASSEIEFDGRRRVAGRRTRARRPVHRGAWSTEPAATARSARAAGMRTVTRGRPARPRPSRRGRHLIDQPAMRTCSPTWPSNPRPPQRSRCGSPAPLTTTAGTREVDFRRMGRPSASTGSASAARPRR